MTFKDTQRIRNPAWQKLREADFVPGHKPPDRKATLPLRGWTAWEGSFRAGMRGARLQMRLELSSSQILQGLRGHG